MNKDLRALKHAIRKAAEEAQAQGVAYRVSRHANDYAWGVAYDRRRANLVVVVSPTGIFSHVEPDLVTAAVVQELEEERGNATKT